MLSHFTFVDDAGNLIGHMKCPSAEFVERVFRFADGLDPERRISQFDVYSSDIHFGSVVWSYPGRWEWRRAG